LHQDVQVQRADIPATEPLWTVPSPCQHLLPVSVGAADDPSHQLTKAQSPLLCHLLVCWHSLQ